MFTEEYEKKDMTIGAGKANLLAVVFALPLVLALAVIYAAIWFRHWNATNIPEMLGYYHSLVLPGPVVILGMILLGVLAHELIHGLTWATFAPNGYQSISYGIIWKFLTPYCHCKEPLLLKHYRIGGIMPALILGIVPSLAGIISGNFPLFLFGWWFTFAAGGDFLTLWMLRKEPGTILVQDHPDKIGCMLLVKKKWEN